MTAFHNNYAIQTGKGIVHLGDVMQLAEVTATPSAPPTGTVHLYVKGDGKLYAQTADGSEYSLLDGSSGSSQTYTQKLQSIETANLIAHWPLAEAAGTTVTDESGNNYAGSYSGVTLGATGIGDGRTAASFIGSSSSIASMHSSGLDTAFDRNEGTLLAWAKVLDASVWTDGADHTVMRIGLDSQDIAISIRLSSNNNELEVFRNANNVSKSWTIGSLSDTGWMCLALTWSTTSDEQKLYISGTQVGATLTGLGDGAGKTLSSRVNIGAFASSGNKRTWEGDLAHVALWSTALSASQLTNLASV